MNETTSPRRVLHLVLEGFPAEKIEPLRDESSEVFVLTEAKAREALEKIFATETIAVWSELSPPESKNPSS
jgi:hypothetical protein